MATLILTPPGHNSTSRDAKRMAERENHFGVSYGMEPAYLEATPLAHSQSRSEAAQALDYLESTEQASHYSEADVRYDYPRCLGGRNSPRIKLANYAIVAMENVELRRLRSFYPRAG